MQLRKMRFITFSTIAPHQNRYHKFKKCVNALRASPRESVLFKTLSVKNVVVPERVIWRLSWFSRRSALEQISCGGFGRVSEINANVNGATTGHRKILTKSLMDRGENSESIPHGPGPRKSQKYFSKILSRVVQELNQYLCIPYTRQSPVPSKDRCLWTHVYIISNIVSAKVKICIKLHGFCTLFNFFWNLTPETFRVVKDHSLC